MSARIKLPREREYQGSALLGGDEQLVLQHEVHAGVGRGEFVLHYQPKVDTWTGRLLGVEALVRWNHPTRGLLPPDAFITLAEESGAIIDLGTWVLQTACRQASTWARSTDEPLSVAVNISGRDLEEGHLLDRVRLVLEETGLDPALLELELTESTAVRQDAGTLMILREIRGHGVRIAIDDFGTGYSTLSRLQDFPIDTLKIDRSFVDRITSSVADAPIVAATIAMARDLELTVVAEGVETEAQRMFLARHGCAQLQGYLISHPVEAERILPMLHDPPLRPIEDPQWAVLESMVGVAASEPTVEDLARGLLVELERLTGFESVYLTRIHWERDEQEILFSRNSGVIAVPEGLVVPWDTVSRRALTDGPQYTDRVPAAYTSARAGQTSLTTFVSVPLLLTDGTIFGTLSGATGRRMTLGDPVLIVMRTFAGLISAQISGSAADARLVGSAVRGRVYSRRSESARLGTTKDARNIGRARDPFH